MKSQISSFLSKNYISKLANLLQINQYWL